MLDPQFGPDLFLRDRAGLREILFTRDDFAGLQGSWVKDGAVSFISEKPIKLTLALSESDLSRFNSFSLKVFNHSTSPILVGMKLVHSSSTGENSGYNVSLSGGRELLQSGIWTELKFPKESFGVYGNPHGWCNIEEIELHFLREKGRSDPDELNISIESMEGKWRDLPIGPRLTENALSCVLDRDVECTTQLLDSRCRPVLTDMKFSLFKPYDGENKALFIPPPHPYPQETAKEILAGRIMGQNFSEIKWDANPVGALEWTHFLNRHHFMRGLVKAIAIGTIEEYTAKCARSLDHLIESWILANPVPVGSNGGAGRTWETLTTAWRLREWFWVVGIGWSHNVFRNTTKILMLRSIWEHARHLTDHKGHPNNWIIVESAALALTGILFPEFVEARQWIEEGLDWLIDESDRQFFSDGVHFELSPLYHSICIHAMLEVKHAALVRKIELPIGFGSLVNNGLDYLAALARPDYTWPSINDSGSANGNYINLLAWAGEIFNQPKLKRFGHCRASSEEQELPTLDSTLRVFPDAGIAVMRSSHDRTANHLVFRAGPPGATHFHQDILSLDVTAQGVLRLIDPGITTYTPDPLTDYYRSAASHNTILIDGKGAQLESLSFAERIEPAGLSFQWSSEGNTEIVRGTYKGPWTGLEHEVSLTRTVMSIEGEYWIVVDDIVGAGEHEITTCWQFSPGRVDVDIETNAARCVDARGVQFEVKPLIKDKPFQIEVHTGSKRPPRGWISLDGTDVPCTTVYYSVKWEITASVAWALIPLSGLTKSVVSAIADHGGTSRCFELTFTDGHKKEVHFQ